MANPNSKKKYELENIDDFITDFNNPEFKLGQLVRVSDEDQENPDAILELNGQKKIALEATIAFAPGYRPHETHPDEPAYNPHPVIDDIFRRIETKSLADYKDKGIDQVWLLISGGAYISDHDLMDRLKELKRNNFDRVFIHKGIHPVILEITK